MHTSVCVGMEPHRAQELCAAPAVPARRLLGAPSLCRQHKKAERPWHQHVQLCKSFAVTDPRQQDSILPCPNASSRAHKEHCGKGSDTSARGKVCSPSLHPLVQPPQTEPVPPRTPEHNEGEALGLEGGVSPSAAGRGYAPAGPALR